MLHELKDVKWSEHALYLWFSKTPVARTKSFAAGEINVDLDDSGAVVGVEILSLGPDQLESLAEIARRYQLSLDAFKYAARKSA